MFAGRGLAVPSCTAGSLPPSVARPTGQSAASIGCERIVREHTDSTR